MWMTRNMEGPECGGRRIWRNVEVAECGGSKMRRTRNMENAERGGQYTVGCKVVVLRKGLLAVRQRVRRRGHERLAMDRV
jgi:hypothetical protein